MKHKVELEWNAYIYDWNTNNITTINVLTENLKQDIEKAYKKKELKTWKDLYELINKYMMCRYWSRTEYEMIVSDMPAGYGRTCERKLDVYEQLFINMKRITDYINNEMQIGLK